jgi:hypothetical protein
MEFYKSENFFKQASHKLNVFIPFVLHLMNKMVSLSLIFKTLSEFVFEKIVYNL